MARIGVGDKAPDFDLEGTEGRRYGLADCHGHWLVFCSYRDAADRLDDLDAKVWGISPQSVESHERFRRKYGLTVPLLSDPDRAVIRAYGVLGPGGLVRRSIFMVDPGGRVRYRHAALLGLHYRDVGELRSALQGVRSAPA
jgi:thioredoxin-dependent peroxiredoxin